MSSLIFNERVVAVGTITEDAESYFVNEVRYPKCIMDGTFFIDQEPSSSSALGWVYNNGQFVAVQPEEKPAVVVPSTSTKEELMAQLAALTAKINAL